MSYAIGLSLPKDIPADPDRSFKYISIGVVVFHLMFILMISLQKYETPVPLKPVQKLVVHTINLETGRPAGQAPQQRSISKPAPEPVYVPVSIPEPEPEVAVSKEIEPEPEAVPQQEYEPEHPEEPEVIEEAPAKPIPKMTKEVEPTKSKVVPIKKTVKKAAVKKTTEKSKKVTPKKAAPKKETPKKTTPKKETPKKAAPKKETKAPTKKDTPKKESAPTAPKIDPKAEALKAKKRELIAQAQASMSKVNKAGSNLTGSVSTKNLAIGSVPSIGSLNVDAISVGDGGDSSLSVREIGYRNELASRLRMLLKLPEHGDVKIKLKLDRSGKFLSVAIVSAQNSTNKKYIEKTLPSLTFPSFGSNFSGHQDYTFSITLSNDL